MALQPLTAVVAAMLGGAFLSFATPVHAQSVALAGTLGNKALLVVNGAPPKTVASGDTHMNVKVISTSGDQAVLELNGKRHTLRVGDAPVSVGAGGQAGAAGQSQRIVLNAGSGGHFMTPGQINGRSVQFMVDTGATSVAMSAGDADRMGLRYRDGQSVRMTTANGVTSAYRVKLDSVRVGDVEVHDVDAIVSPQPMPYILLGNSFLTRFQMLRENEQMILVRRY